MTLHTNWVTPVAQVSQALISEGLFLTCSFDLQTARPLHASYICPVHGTAQCDGQMVVLLVYDRDNPPLTLEIHGHEGLISIAIIDTSEQRPDPHLATLILQKLTEMSISKRNLEVVSNGR